MNGLETELDVAIPELDSHYSPGDNSSDNDDNLDDMFAPIHHDEMADTNAVATQEQASADNDTATFDVSTDVDNESHVKSESDNLPLPRLQQNRILSYGHLQGRDGDGSVTTMSRPDEFKGGCHQSHVILQNIIMRQCNLKQGIKKFGNKGKEAVLAELQQLYNRDFMAPVNKYNLTPEEGKGALPYLMFLKEKDVKP